ncbi:tetratricopeptide repeat protein [Rheinheimera nanhaiensis]|uniref:TPR repeat-containing protein n=1 Tax=Rheinheimera nanhaiensis E407-8 TaxID=562729 RepID=I1DUZ7_9GAMM|nr:TPR repeat-containing protein [Rheinheimera nanhaiensis]GAB57875.1 TPR repeat-containing protein [Rheinheimera nanhaiensis E407-8]
MKSEGGVVAPPQSVLLQTAVAPVPTVTDIFALTAEQQREFLAYFNAPSRQAVAKHRRIYHFLSEHLTGFTYLGENYSAAQSYASKSGNCISLAVLTKALADLVGVEIEFQTIVSAPVYSIDGDFMLSSDHVRTILYDPDFVAPNDAVYFSKPAIIVDYLPAATDVTGPRVSENTFIAMFYRNLAADAVLQANYTQALALLRTALDYAPTYAAVINLIAIVHRRVEQQTIAEQFYQYGLQVADVKTTLISNYAVLKHNMGETEQAEALLQSLKSHDEHDPYRWYILGKEAAFKQQYDDAIVFYRKAITQAPYLHQLHFELAVAYYNNHQPARARQSLATAAELSLITNQQQRYHAKLQAIARRQ